MDDFSASDSGHRVTDEGGPLAPGVRVKDGRDHYLAENGFKVEEYGAPTFRLKILGRYFDFPNPPDRRWAIRLHDLHHVATGYGTDFAGEAEIGAWELRAGCRTWVVYYLNVWAVLIGMVVAPGRVVAAFRAARGARSLYRSSLTYEEALQKTVGELRAHLGVPEHGVVGERRLHPDAPSLAGAERVAAAA